MTVNALRGRSKPGGTRPETPAIGEDDANIVDCPSCKRPLDATSRRCPGCGTLLIAGVQASKAFIFVAFGLAVGLMVGASVMGVATLGIQTTSATTPSTAPAESVAPAPTTAPIATAPTGGTASSFVPVAATAALKGTAAVNARIASTAAPLSAALADADFDSQAVAQMLRRLNFEVGTAQALLPALTSWGDASSVHAQLRDFYDALRATASQALDSSIRNDEAYKAAARDVLQQLAGLPAIVSASRDLAGSAGVELPAVEQP